jgi:hypothetical protein
MKRSSVVNLTVMGGIMAAAAGLDVVGSGWRCRQVEDYDSPAQCLNAGRFPAAACNQAFDMARLAGNGSGAGVRLSRTSGGDVSAFALSRPSPGGALNGVGQSFSLGRDASCRSGSSSSSSSSSRSYSGGSSSSGDSSGSGSHSVFGISRGGFGATGHAFSSGG